MIVTDRAQQFDHLESIDRNIEKVNARLAELEETAKAIPQGHFEEANSKTLMAALRAALIVLEDQRRSIPTSGGVV
ncbi:hypothetical protein [Eleftheria terrae]|uniref:hypothetical protein n=1 Tax=Eleftheria terrae TaxID=1597781 RepID=UPI00263B0234|nr:hypothetical protein [Eleftheria terrae]WKB56076.1 hypothetical protein N7L95_28880 [Eleftheria terrae]